LGHDWTGGTLQSTAADVKQTLPGIIDHRISPGNPVVPGLRNPSMGLSNEQV
jgi:hypothetical protein